ncbi:hypothetical protein GCM10023153_06330 [Ornithinibacter aureus]|uniref:Uncharacterized protein n=1 Tax=Ornithinibacter aureus TaxID=622664 RepID=A0ABP8JF69_9MICO|nr:hypothetical protein [Ornithinibacter aureus]
MEIPQYWATASGFSPHLGAEGGELVVWGWSQTSEFDAQGVARSRLAEALERVAVEGGLPDGRGYYPRMPLREPILEEVASSSGHRLGVVTRNRMGCEVLCSDVLFIADVDVPELGGEGDAGGGDTASDGVGGASVGGGFLTRLWRVVSGGPEPTPMTTSPQDPRPQDPRPQDRPASEVVRAADLPAPTDQESVERRACEPVWAFAQRHPELGVRVYRTAAGLRVIVTGAQAPPMSPRARDLLTELSSDPLYVELCATHDSYRARLTPKPFRVDWGAPSWRWPFADERARQGHEEWLAQYRQKCDGYAVCRLVSASGAIPTVDEQRLIALHDARCRVGSGLPLA